MIDAKSIEPDTQAAPKAGVRRRVVLVATAVCSLLVAWTCLKAAAFHLCANSLMRQLEVPPPESGHERPLRLPLPIAGEVVLLPPYASRITAMAVLPGRPDALVDEVAAAGSQEDDHDFTLVWLSGDRVVWSNRVSVDSALHRSALHLPAHWKF